MSDVLILDPLVGHTSPETAYVVNDYPYGFRLRCKIRYWLEYRKGMGFRLGSQTTNPKKPGEYWNAPKYSTYCNLAVMGLDSSNHVTWVGVGYNTELLETFYQIYGHTFDVNQTYQYNGLAAAKKAYEARAHWICR